MSDLADDLLNSEIEVDQPAQPVINRTVIKKTATKARAGTGKTAAKKTTSAAATKAATKATKATKAQTEAQREALKDRTNTAEGDDMEKVEEFDDNEQDDSVPVKSKVKRKAKAKDEDAEEGAPVKKVARATKAKAAPVAVAVAAAAVREEILDSQAPRARKPKTVKRAPEPEPIQSIPETQPEAEDVSQSIEEGNEDNMEVDHEPPPPSPPAVKAAHRARSSSQQRQPLPQAIPQRARSTSVQPRTFSRSRAGSVSDNERRIAESDANKKLHEMTRKYEDMRMKYDSLQELAQNAAETNFDKLKRATDEKTKDANNLISSLRREINELRKSSSTSATEAARLQSQVASLQTENEKAKEETKTSQTALSEAQNEVKSLTAKLDAARKSVQAPTEKVPGSAMKNQRDLARSQVGGNPEATKHAALKEELYRDLTGLIITSVKRKDGEDEYSCIQTGRNGSELNLLSCHTFVTLMLTISFAALHFHLTISNDSSMSNPKTPSGLSYEDTEFAYEPLLDQNRDRHLIDILPDYLTEEICFPRNHAVKFYTKVVESMTRKIVMEEE